MKGILASIVLAGAAASISAQQPAPEPKPAQTPATAVEKIEASVKPVEVATPVNEKKETPKIEEAISICDLGIQHSPIVSGLQLRVPEAEAALKAHTQFVADAGDATRKRMTVKLNRDPILENLDSATMTSQGERVNFIKLTYPKTWPSIKDFISDMAPKLGVSRIAFRVDREKNEAFMQCKDFTVELKTGSSGSELTLTEKAPAAKN